MSTKPVDIQPSSKQLEDFYDMKLLDHAQSRGFHGDLGGVAKQLRNGVDQVHQQPFKILTDEQIQDINDDVTRLLEKAKRRPGSRRSAGAMLILETLRKMAWARGKAELESILETYWSMDTEFEEIETEIGEFIERMEDRL